MIPKLLLQFHYPYKRSDAKDDFLVDVRFLRHKSEAVGCCQACMQCLLIIQILMQVIKRGGEKLEYKRRKANPPLLLSGFALGRGMQSLNRAVSVHNSVSFS